MAKTVTKKKKKEVEIAKARLTYILNARALNSYLHETRNRSAMKEKVQVKRTPQAHLSRGNVAQPSL